MRYPQPTRFLDCCSPNEGQIVTWVAGRWQAADPPAGGGDPSAAWPVGSVFTSVVVTDPATLLGFGTWVRIAAGRVLVGQDSGDASFDTAEETGGEKSHVLTVTEMPSHTHVQDPHAHTLQARGSTSASTTGTHMMTSTATGGSSRACASPEAANSATATNQTSGGGGAHNNMPPYLVVYFWKRTA